MAYAGQPALVETLDLRSAAEREEAAFLAQARVVDTVTALGWRPDAATPRGLPGAGVFRLSVPGTQARALVAACHESVLPGLWAAWSATIPVRNAG
jgi:urease accessory protein